MMSQMIEIYDPFDERGYFGVVSDLKPGLGGGLDRFNMIFAAQSSQYPGKGKQEQEMTIIRSKYRKQGNHNGAYWKPMTEKQQTAVFGAAVAEAQKSKMPKTASSLPPLLLISLTNEIFWDRARARTRTRTRTRTRRTDRAMREVALLLRTTTHFLYKQLLVVCSVFSFVAFSLVCGAERTPLHLVLIPRMIRFRFRASSQHI
eukprot:COSAG04_NODE_9223_length_885_cov_1.127226_1_plen_203_part_00